MVDKNALSELPAPTDNVQGNWLSIVPRAGPKLPAARITSTSLEGFKAPKPIKSVAVSWYPRDMLIMSTPSAMAVSMAAITSSAVQKKLSMISGCDQQGLYMARRDNGAPPEAVPSANPPTADTLETRRPAAIEAV